jgi:hypothetical protein
MRLRNLAIASLILLAGCASSGNGDTAGPASPSGSPSADPGAAMPPVTVSRTGGIAGTTDQYTVAPDGSLTGTSRTEPSVKKQLTAAQLAELRGLATDKTLSAEAAKSPVGPKGCADGFRYTVTAGTATVTGIDCGGLAKDAPTMWKIVQLVQSAAAA